MSRMSATDVFEAIWAWFAGIVVVTGVGFVVLRALFGWWPTATPTDWFTFVVACFAAVSLALGGISMYVWARTRS